MFNRTNKSRWKIKRDSPFDPVLLWLRDNPKLLTHARLFSPIEMIGAALIVTLHMEKHSDEELLEDITWMRHTLRYKHPSLNISALCWKTAWDFASIELNERRADKASVPPFTRNATEWADKDKEKMQHYL